MQQRSKGRGVLVLGGVRSGNLLKLPDVSIYVDELCDALERCLNDVLLVSNEAGGGVVPACALQRQFRDLPGEINQRVAAIADVVMPMVAGLPMIRKGSL